MTATAAGFAEKLNGRVDRRLAPGAPGDPFIEPGACQAYAERASKGLDDRIRSEK